MVSASSPDRLVTNHQLKCHATAKLFALPQCHRYNAMASSTDRHSASNMSITLTINDELTTGDVVNSLDIDFLSEEITIRELIRSRVFQEVKDHVAEQSGKKLWQGLVCPSEAEAVANGFQLKAKKKIDWEQQFEKACEAFSCNQLLILVDDKQAASLDEKITLTPQTNISFLRLVMLVGG